MKLNCQNDSEFGKLLTALATDAVDTSIHFTLYKDLSESITEYFVEFNQSNTFWVLTFEAHLETTLTKLCRVYDSHNKSLNLRTLLETINSKLSFFENEKFRQRLKGNEAVESLAETNRVPSAKTIAADLQMVSKNDPLVKKLIFWRNNYYAHRSPVFAIEPKKLAKRFPISIQEVETLLKRAMRIINEYSGLFTAGGYSSTMVGKSDYKTVLRSIRESLEAREAVYQEDVRRFAEH